ncbi:MAG TPA: hypothetical protein VF173_14015 [Thermoanaerobaculia bacterium]|nr:hypothetical protein [Thermoanaerobaculia bacterium]
MKVATGKIVGGEVVLDGEPWEEGTRVTILAADPEETVELSPEEEAELLQALAEADAGDVVDGEEFLRELWRRRRAPGSEPRF